jgi:hypothetical protein
MALQGKIKKKLVLTDPGHTMYVRLYRDLICYGGKTAK